MKAKVRGAERAMEEQVADMRRPPPRLAAEGILVTAKSLKMRLSRRRRRRAQ